MIPQGLHGDLRRVFRKTGKQMTHNFADADPWQEPEPEPAWDRVFIVIGTGIGGRKS